MATWVTHLMVADEVIEKIPSLCRHEFFVGNTRMRGRNSSKARKRIWDMKEDISEKRMEGS